MKQKIFICIKSIMRAISPNGVTPRWNAKNFGPLYVPKSGDNIEVTRSNMNLYKRLIEFETGEKLTFKKGDVLLGSEPITEYRFARDYYFLCGDNVLDSSDSRYWGFVPKEFIVGVVSRITYSRDRETNEFRWGRLMRSVMKR